MSDVLKTSGDGSIHNPAVGSALGTSLTLAVILVASAIWFDLFAPVAERWSAVPTYDSVFFIKLAEQILNMKEFGWLGYHEPFFYPLTIAVLTGFTGDLYVSAVMISRVSVVLLPAVVYLLAASLFSRRVALSASLLVLFFPHLRAISGTSQSEALNIFLVTTALYLLWMARQRKMYPIAAGAGLFFVMAYLTRSEGLFILLLASGSLLVAARSGTAENRTTRKIILTALITFTLLVSPYIGYLSHHYGALTVGTKTSSIYFWVREKCFHDPDPERSEWGLNDRGELNIISMKSRDLLAYWARDLPRSFKVYVKNFTEQLPGRIPNDGGIAQYPQVFPLYLAIPLVGGLFFCFRRRHSVTPVGYLLSVFLLLFIYPLLTGGWWRYLLNVLPLFLILSAVAMDEIAASLLCDKRSRVLLAAAILLICSYHIWVVSWRSAPQTVVSYQKNKSTIAEETKKAGAWARQIIPADATYMVQWTRLPFYLQGRWIAMPAADLDDVLLYARKNSVRYLLIESGDVVTASQLANAAIPGVTYVGSYAARSGNYFCSLLRLM